MKKNTKIKYKYSYSDKSMANQILEYADCNPSKIAYEFMGRKCNYKKFKSQIFSYARSLKNVGIKEGDTISICCVNTPSAIVMLYAANLIGAIVSMIHPLSSAYEIEDYLNQSKSKMLFVLDMIYPKVKNVIENTCVDNIVVGGIGNDLGFFKKMFFKITSKKSKVDYSDSVISLNDFLNYGYDYSDELIVDRKPEDPAAILFSGGTTGVQKGILLSNLNFNAFAVHSHEVIGNDNSVKSMLAILPLFHGFGLAACIHNSLYYGVKVILVPKFSTKDFSYTIKKYKPNFICGTPSLFLSLTNEELKKNSLSCVKYAVSGGDFMSAKDKNIIEKYFKSHGSNAKITISYGLTETTAGVAFTKPDLYKEGAVGYPSYDTKFKILSVDGVDELPFGKEGEVYISGPTVMMEYFNNIKATKEALSKDEHGNVWLRTGDIGYLDKDGQLFFKQRLKRMIVSNGYNIYPSYIENILNSHSDISCSVVVGKKDKIRGQIAKAYIVLKDEIKKSDVELDKIKKYCESRISKYSLPKEYEFIDSLPTTHLGKIDYKKLEKEHIDK